MKTPHLFTLNQAAKATGRSKGTISKALASGKLSCAAKDGNAYQIEAAELFRVFPQKPDTPGPGDRLETPSTPAENAILTAQLAGLRGELEQIRSERDDLRRRLDAEAEERRKLTALLVDRRKPERPWWRLWRA